MTDLKPNISYCGNTIAQSTTAQLGTATDWKNATASTFFTIALKNDGTIYSCGRNLSGQLGDGTTINKNIPTAIVCPTTVLSSQDFEVGELKIYPNPVNDFLQISFDTTISKIAIYNLLGQEVITKTLNANQGTIDVSGLASGTYLVKVLSGQQIKTLKVIKQ